ncbi:hypothetical protein CTI12_AA388410 [Artemisia annua]|uniref:Uncharacterized protein n=1 Tax=Artemisia annua TaxID=35608 RepID=A0A2U1LD50_ARTAN|nr:hypothetical protein CTI12_AA388410 [Artemisia annua]
MKRSTTRGNCRVAITAIGKKASNTPIGVLVPTSMVFDHKRQDTRLHKRLPSSQLQRPIINRLGKLIRKSFSEKRVVRIDKKTNSEVAAENSEIASATAKIVKAISFLNNGMPVS